MKGPAPVATVQRIAAGDTACVAMAEKILEVLRRANDETEKIMAGELERALSVQAQMRRELEEARARNVELQKDLDKMTTQKNYVTDAFETSRKEASRLRSDNQANEQDLTRLRKMVEDLQAERIVDQIGRRSVFADLQALELERDVLGRALGTATKQLYGKQQAAAAEREAAASPAPKGRGVSAKPRLKPTSKALAGSPAVISSPRATGSASKKAGVSAGGGRV